MSNERRRPKGTSSGGQFAPNANPESTLQLTSEAEPLDVNCVVVEEHKDGWTIDDDDYIFTLSRPDEDERRDFWVARFDDQEHEEMEADSDGCAGDTFEDVIGLFDEWPAVKQAMIQAHANWSKAEPAVDLESKTSDSAHSPRDLLNGGYTPEALAEFESIWTGQKDGLSETAAKMNLLQREQQREDLEAGIITPRKIIGTGYDKGVDTRKMAMDVLDEQIAQTKLAINSRGQSSSVNRRNVVHSLSDQTITSLPTRHGFPRIQPF